MSNQRSSPEFNDEAGRQVVERHYSAAEVAERLSVSVHSLKRSVEAVKPNWTEQCTAVLVEVKSEILKLWAQLRRDFTVDHPNRVTATDIPCIRKPQGWLYLAAVMDLYARRIIGWSMK